MANRNIKSSEEQETVGVPSKRQDVFSKESIVESAGGVREERTL